MSNRICLRLAFTILLSFVLSTAQSAPDRTQWGSNISIGLGEESGELTCFGCSIRIRGHVMGDVTVFGGSIMIEDQGQVNGDTAVFGGGMRLDKETKVGGDVAVFGGRLRRDPGASVGGEVSNFSGPVWILLIFVLPLVIVGVFLGLVVWVIRRLMRPAVPSVAYR